MLDALGNLGDFIGGIAVIVTLIYLATQVRLHTAALRTASRQDISAGYRAQNDHLIDPQVSEAYALGLRHYPDMPSEQKRIFAHAINDHALFFQTAFALYEAGTLGEENYTPYLTWFACHLATPGGSIWWNEAGAFYNADLVHAIELKLSEQKLPNVLGMGFFAIDDRSSTS
jgi:hypothetical protein